jgi:hypothetical protein
MVDQELVELYVAETKLSIATVTAFVQAGVEPPHRDQVDRIGYTVAQTRILSKEAAA